MKMKEMLKLSPHRRRRILAGFMAFVLMFSNVLMEAQAAIPMISDGNGGFFLVDRDSDEDSGYQENVTGEPEGLEEPEAPEEEEYDFQIDIQPEIKLEDGEKQWTGGWISYEYKNSDGHQSLGQALLQSDKYQEEYGDLPLNLPGTWESDDDNILEVKPDGTAIVKGRGYVDVTFTYNASEVNTEQVTTSGGSSVSGNKGTEAGGAGSGAADSEDTNKDGNEAAVPNEEETETPAEGETVAAAEGETKDSAEEETEASTEEETAAPTEEETEAATKEETAAPTEDEMTAPSEEETEAATEAEKEAEASTEAETEAQAEEVTEASEEKETEALADGSAAAAEIVYDLFLMGSPSANPPELTTPPEETETQSEAPTEKETEAQTEAETESSTEAETEAETEEEKETETSTEAETEASTETKAAEETETETEAPTEAEDETKSETEGEPESSAANTEENGETNSETVAAPQTSGGSGSGSSGTSGNHVSSDESTADAYALEDGTELTWVVKIESDKVTVYSGEPYNDVLNLSMKAGDEWPEFGATHLKDMPEDPPYGVNVTLPDNGTWKSMDEDVISLTADGGMTVKVDDGIGEIAYSYADESGEVAIAMWDVVIGVGIRLMVDAPINYLPWCDFYGHIRECGMQVYTGDFKLSVHAYVDDTDASSNNQMQAVFCIERKTGMQKGHWFGDKTNDTVNGSDYEHLTADQLALIGIILQAAKDLNYDKFSWYTDAEINNWLTRGGKVKSNTDWQEALAVQIMVWDVTVNGATAGNFINRTSYLDTALGKGTFVTTICNNIRWYYNKLEEKVEQLLANQDSTLDLGTPTGTLQSANGKITGRLTYTVSDTVDNVTWTGSCVKSVTWEGDKIYVDIEMTTDGDPQTYTITATKKADPSGIVVWTDNVYNPGSSRNNSQDLVYRTGNVYISKSGSASNTINPSDFGPQPISVSLGVKKNISGDVPSTNKPFVFTLSSADGPMPANSEITVNGPQEGSFGTITFDKSLNIKQGESKNYHYTITESKKTGVDYGGYGFASSKTITINVANINNTLMATIDGENVSNSTYFVDITNTYKVTPVTWAPSVTKKFKGDTDLKQGERKFTFVLSLTGGEPSGGVEMPLDTKAVVSSENEWHDTFDELTFKKAGTYYFSIEEQNPGWAGYASGLAAKQEITVVVKDENGVLKTYNSDGTSPVVSGFSFTNTFDFVDTEWTPQVRKTVDTSDGGLNHEIPDGYRKDFEFTLTQEASDNTQVIISSPSVQSTYPYTGILSFGQIKFSKPGTYHFTVEEKQEAPDPRGYTYDKTVYNVTVEVTSDEGGTLSKTVNVSKTSGKYTASGPAFGDVYTFDFTNSYKPEPTEQVLNVMKHVDEKTPRPEVLFYLSPDKIPTFTFDLTLSEVTDNDGTVIKNTDGFDIDSFADLPASTSISVKWNENDKTVSFEPIKFYRAGIYTFTISEKDSDAIPGYSYADSQDVVITVIDNNGQLKVDNVVYEQPKKDDGKEYTVFTNTYSASEIEFGPSVTKRILGSVRPTDKEFTFKLSDLNGDKGGYTMPEKLELTIKGETTDQFDKIQFKQPGSYKFRIEEEKGSDSGYTYDENSWTVTVEIADVGSILQLKKVTYSSDAEYTDIHQSNASATFTNTYKVEPTSDTQSVHKVITGDSTPDDKVFAFTRKLVKAPEFGEYDVNNGRLSVGGTPLFNLNGNDGVTANPLPADQNTITITGAGTASFPEYTFTAAGTYVFEIREVDTGISGYHYDTFAWRVTYEIVDNGGELEIAKGYPKYEKFAGEGTEVEVDSGMLPNIGFLPVPGNGRIQVGGNSGIQPIDAGLTGPVIDWSNQDRLDGTNEMVEGPNPDEITFTNTYTVEPTELALGIFKEIDGDIPADNDGYDFKFSLGVVDENTKNEVAAGNVVMPDGTITVTVGGSGSGSGYFDHIVFNKAGEYKFQIEEVKDDIPGFDYDTSVYDVEVTVEDKDSELTVTKGTIWNENGESVGEGLGKINDTDSLSTRFTNKYTTTPITFDPQVRKTVEGQPTEDETFTFRILAAEEYGDYVEMPADDTVTVVGEGNAKFGQITFNHTGTYDFTILEEAGKNPYYTYDESEWTLTVEIVDNDSQLEVKDSSVAYKKAGAVNMEEAIFNNTYTIPGNLVIRKEVSGNRGERERDFNFTVELTDAAGAPLQGEYQYTGSSTIQGVAAPADGVVVNGNLTVTLRHGQQITINDVPAGTKYTVTEAEADTEGYDTTVDVDGSAAEDVAEGTIVTSWTTTVEYENYRNRSGGTTPGGNPGGGPGGNPNSNIPDNPTPLADLPDGMVPLGAAPVEQILDEDVPLAFLAPQTGDETPVGALGVLALAALGLMGAFGFLGFRKKEDSE